MPFDWKEFIKLAATLNAYSPSNAQMRTATSRAYYGAFILTRNYLGYSADRKPDVHRRVIEKLKSSDLKAEVSLGNILFDLREARSKADYHCHYIPVARETEVHIQ
jgi:uncharacterized protein (UPF0332 family)